MSKINKVVLAYSGGLDTSIILKWLQDVYDCEVVTFTADIGQGEEVEPARAKAEAMGIKEIYIEDIDKIVVATEMKSYLPFKNMDETPVYVIGDAKKVGKAQEAIHDAYKLAISL